ncbi:MAG TPA: hypothetical protein VNS63_17670 [Blastocatellia bacterium]|nr:hypothetical protein [Blastocatellia bacterium]
MSRLDDELRMAFRHEQPSPDFTDRVLEQISRQPAPRIRWWQTLVALFQPPTLKWVAIGATAALLVAIGASQYARLHPGVIDDGDKVEKTADGSSAGASGEVPGASAPDPRRVAQAPPQAPKPRLNSVRHLVATSNTKPRDARPKHRLVNPEAEAARDKVMLALQITSATLNDAQQAIRDDGYKAQP